MDINFIWSSECSVRVQCQKRSKVIIDVKDQYCCIQLCKVSRSIQYLGQKYLRLFQLIKVLNNHSTIINHVMISDAFRFERSRVPSLSRYLTKRPLHPSTYTAYYIMYKDLLPKYKKYYLNNSHTGVIGATLLKCFACRQGHFV